MASVPRQCFLSRLPLGLADRPLHTSARVTLLHRNAIAGRQAEVSGLVFEDRVMEKSCL